MKFTHIKIPYRAECIQLAETNHNEVIEFLHSEGYTAWRVDNFIYYSRPGQGTCGLPVSSWIRKGEDGIIKFFSDEEFQLKYQKIIDFVDSEMKLKYLLNHCLMMINNYDSLKNSSFHLNLIMEINQKLFSKQEEL